MTAARVRARIRELAKKGRYVITEYCAMRLLERGVSEDDVRHVLTTAHGCWLQANGRWKLEGTDRDDERLVLVVALEAGVVLVTAYRGDEDDDDEG